MKRIFKGLKAYFSDWKNWLTHSIIGILILIVALFAPVNIYLRLGFVGLVVAFNVVRMKYTDV